MSKFKMWELFGRKLKLPYFNNKNQESITQDLDLPKLTFKKSPSASEKCLLLYQVLRENVVPNSNPLGIKRECYILMQIQYTKNLNPGRFGLG